MCDGQNSGGKIKSSFLYSGIITIPYRRPLFFVLPGYPFFTIHYQLIRKCASVPTFGYERNFLTVKFKMNV
ncbi:hypothetical protein CE91St54_61550 [Hungatella hathewayi]|uniref:Uncharacterized protein n=1 Tax=Hungatella hathewayi TaxID=154046 RepID=A0AA37N3Z7_9FIRM|nr:hypothetical protein CE91St55_35510 [Hungatella hathewayi]GKH11047.1 hypothetical protein CE91St54_61550 [Hungatella hathewayi]